MLLTAISFIAFIILFLYLSYCSFKGKSAFIPLYVRSGVFLAAITLSPATINVYSNHLLSFIIHLFFIFFISIIIFHIQKDTFLFFLKSKINTPQTIAEHALQNLDIPYESLDNSTKLREHEEISLLYPRPRNECISFREVQNEALRKQIIQEIKNVLPIYTKPSKILGFMFLITITILLYSVTRM